MSTDRYEGDTERVGGRKDPVISDPDDYNHKRRLRQIHDARERFQQVLRQQSLLMTNDSRRGISELTYRKIVRDALIDYLIEVEPVMRNSDIESGDVYWAEKAVTTGPRGRDITLQRIVGETGSITDRNGDEVPLPIPVSRDAYRLANRFLANIGFGLEVDDGLPVEKGFDSVSAETVKTEVNGDGDN